MSPLLELRDLRVWYPLRGGLVGRVHNHVRAVDGISLQIFPGEVVGLVGESGSGKSTVARAIMRLVKPAAGQILLDGHDIATLTGKALIDYRRSIQIVFQDPFASLNPRHTILEALTEAPLAHRLITTAERRPFALQLLSDVGVSAEALDRYPHAFSGGQRQRICIARALALQPRLLICDEAVSALDLSVQAQILNLLGSLRQQKGLTYLFITHDLGVVQHLADRLAVMSQGKIVESGDTTAIFQAPQHDYTKTLLSTDNWR